MTDHDFVHRGFTFSRNPTCDQCGVRKNDHHLRSVTRYGGAPDDDAADVIDGTLTTAAVVLGSFDHHRHDEYQPPSPDAPTHHATSHTPTPTYHHDTSSSHSHGSHDSGHTSSDSGGGSSDGGGGGSSE